MIVGAANGDKINIIVARGAIYCNFDFFFLLWNDFFLVSRTCYVFGKSNAYMRYYNCGMHICKINESKFPYHKRDT